MKFKRLGLYVMAAVLMVPTTSVVPALATSADLENATDDAVMDETTAALQTQEKDVATETEELTESTVTLEDVELSSLTFQMPDGIKVGDLDVSGKTGSEIEEMIDDYIDKISAMQIEIKLGSQSESYQLSDFGLTCMNKGQIGAKLANVKSGSLIDQYKAFKDVTVGELVPALEIGYDQDKMIAEIDAIKSTYEKEAKDASVTYEGGVFTVSESVDGFALDEEALKKNLIAAMDSWDRASDIQILASVIETPAKIQSSVFEGMGDLLGTCTTTYINENPARNGNVEQAAKNINGHIFLPGEEISTLDMISPVTVEGGYGMAPSYVGASQVDTIGGGICQVATTLYDAYLGAEIEIIKRKNHSKLVSYVDPGFDATVFPDDGLDFVAMNSLEHAIYIEAVTDGKEITINIYGVETRPENRRVEYRSVETSREETGVASDEPDKGIKPGRVVWLVTPHDKVIAELWKDIYIDDELSESIMLHTDYYAAMEGIRRYGAPEDDEGNTDYYVRDDGYVVRIEDKDDPDAETFRLNPDGSFLDDPLEKEEETEETEDDTEETSKAPGSKPQNETTAPEETTVKPTTPETTTIEETEPETPEETVPTTEQETTAPPATEKPSGTTTQTPEPESTAAPEQTAPEETLPAEE